MHVYIYIFFSYIYIFMIKIYNRRCRYRRRRLRCLRYTYSVFQGKTFTRFNNTCRNITPSVHFAPIFEYSMIV